MIAIGPAWAAAAATAERLVCANSPVRRYAATAHPATVKAIRIGFCTALPRWGADDGGVVSMLMDSRGHRRGQRMRGEELFDRRSGCRRLVGWQAEHDAQCGGEVCQAVAALGMGEAARLHVASRGEEPHPRGLRESSPVEAVVAGAAVVGGDE